MHVRTVLKCSSPIRALTFTAMAATTTTSTAQKLRPDTSTPPHQPPSSSSQSVASNDDLLTEILVRLPIRPLLKFKSVSKHWLSLISSPYFSRRRTPKSNLLSGLFLPAGHFHSSPKIPEFDFVPINGNSQVAPPFRSFTFIDDPAGIKILQSCNGLMLCCSYQEQDSNRDYYVYNPTTMHFSVLPNPANGSVFNSVLGIALAFDPSEPSCYRLVSVLSCEFLPYHYQIWVFSSKTKSWKHSGNPFTTCHIFDFHHGVFWNGAIYWIGDLGTTLRFDLNHERFREITKPENLTGFEMGFSYLGQSCDHLHLILIDEPQATQFNVYEMAKNCSKWFVKYRVDFSSVCSAFPEMRRRFDEVSDLNCYDFSVLHVGRGEDEGGSYLVLHISGKVISYNFKDKSLKKLFEFSGSIGGSEGSLTYGWHDTYQYVETLAHV